MLKKPTILKCFDDFHDIAIRQDLLSWLFTTFDLDQDSRVSDESAVSGCLEFANRHRILVEPACGAGLSLIYEKSECLADAQRILVVVCGGIGVNLDQLNSWATQMGLRQ